MVTVADSQLSGHPWWSGKGITRVGLRTASTMVLLADTMGVRCSPLTFATIVVWKITALTTVSRGRSTSVRIVRSKTTVWIA